MSPMQTSKHICVICDTFDMLLQFKACNDHNIAVGESISSSMQCLYCHAGEALQQPRSHEGLGSK